MTKIFGLFLIIQGLMTIAYGYHKVSPYPDNIWEMNFGISYLKPKGPVKYVESGIIGKDRQVEITRKTYFSKSGNVLIDSSFISGKLDYAREYKYDHKNLLLISMRTKANGQVTWSDSCKNDYESNSRVCMDENKQVEYIEWNSDGYITESWRKDNTGFISHHTYFFLKPNNQIKDCLHILNDHKDTIITKYIYDEKNNLINVTYLKSNKIIKDYNAEYRYRYWPNPVYYSYDSLNRLVKIETTNKEAGKYVFQTIEHDSSGQYVKYFVHGSKGKLKTQYLKSDSTIIFSLRGRNAISERTSSGLTTNKPLFILNLLNLKGELYRQHKVKSVLDNIWEYYFKRNRHY